MKQDKYNGWYNYETWRVNLEWVDEDACQEWLDACTEDHPVRCGVSKKVTQKDRETMTHALAEDLKERMQEYIEGEVVGDTLAGWVQAFVSEVNWRDIAWHQVDAYAEQMETEANE